MAHVHVGRDSGGQEVELFVRDVGSGRPIVLIHGWPLSHASWAYQIADLARRGFRVVAYDRRGFGHSSQPATGYDYDTLADDLNAVLTELALEDVTLVGFSMGGGEVARYMKKYGGARVARVVFVSAVTPYLLKTADNPSGVDASVFAGMMEKMREDRANFVADFGKPFYGVGMLSHPVSQATLDWTFHLAMQASQLATEECARAFSQTDFRRDLIAISLPTLIIHGDKDQTVPIGASADETAKILPHAFYKVYDGAPHGLFITDKDRLTDDIATFASEGRVDAAGLRAA